MTVLAPLLLEGLADISSVVTGMSDTLLNALLLRRSTDTVSIIAVFAWIHSAVKVRP